MLYQFSFSLKQDLIGAIDVLKELFPKLYAVLDIDFEYTADDLYKEMGEPENGKRGQNRTSIDAAIFWIDRENNEYISLIEWKYTEANFGVCSAFSDSCKNINPDNLARKTMHTFSKAQQKILAAYEEGRHRSRQVD